MSTRFFIRLVSTVFGLVALIHFGRIMYEVEVTAGTYEVPMSLSWIGFLATAALAIWGFREAGQFRNA